MYFVDFFKHMFKKTNIPIIIYLVLNVLIIGLGLKVAYGLFGATGEILTSMDSASSGGKTAVEYIVFLLIGLVVYGACLFIALSPVGEWILRLQTGCKEIKRKDQIDFIEPIFCEVYEKAKKQNPRIPDGIRLYIKDEEAPNAFATGRKTICITSGLLNMPPEQIKATIGHEFGHLSHLDTDIILIVSVGNLLVNIVVWIVQAAIVVFGGVGKFFTKTVCAIAGGAAGVGWLGNIFGKLCGAIFTGISIVLSFIIVRVFFKGWTKLGLWLARKASRDNEYLADEFSFNLGYGNFLCELLASFSGGEEKEGLFAMLAESHPASDDRIARLQKLGATYTTVYGGQTQVAQTHVKASGTVGSTTAGMFGNGTISTMEKPESEVKAAEVNEPNTAEHTDKCPHCGFPIEDPNSAFCLMCGKKVIK